MGRVPTGVKDHLGGGGGRSRKSGGLRLIWHFMSINVPIMSRDNLETEAGGEGQEEGVMIQVCA